jgi:hypothetical protein
MKEESGEAGCCLWALTATGLNVRNEYFLQGFEWLGVQSEKVAYRICRGWQA